MTYRTSYSQKIVTIKCSLVEYKTKAFKRYLEEALSENPGKIVVEIDLDE